MTAARQPHHKPVRGDAEPDWAGIAREYLPGGSSNLVQTDRDIISEWQRNLLCGRPLASGQKLILSNVLVFLHGRAT